MSLSTDRPVRRRPWYWTTWLRAYAIAVQTLYVVGWLYTVVALVAPGWSLSHAELAITGLFLMHVCGGVTLTYQPKGSR